MALQKQFMARGIYSMVLPSSLPAVESKNITNSVLNSSDKTLFNRPTSAFGTMSASFARKSLSLNSFQTRSRHCWRIAFALDAGTGGIPTNGNGGQDSINGDNQDGASGRTRLGRLVSAGGRQLLEKLNSVRKNFPMKVFLLLLGFYTANALATILGQTGDWDVLVAGVVVAAIEGIGMLMYRTKKPASVSNSTGRFQSLVVMVNYWKAGVCLGLFVDAFKLGS